MYARMRVENDMQLSITYKQAPIGQNKVYAPLTYHVICLTEGRLVSDENNEEGSFGVYSTNLLEEVATSLRRGDYLIRIKKKR